MAMVMGDSDDGYRAAPAPDACDSNAAVGSAGNDTQMGKQQDNFVNLMDRPTDADIIAWENKIR